MVKQLHLKVLGRVQSVGFRYATLRLAQGLNLTGWVKNISGGEVEIMAEGEESDLNKLLKWTRHGPKLAHVQKVEFKWRSAVGKYNRFQIIF